MSKKLIPAVGYIRMSTGKQEKSPAQQKAEIVKLAKRDGFKIVRWYSDEGISGDATDKRSGFQQMHRDACSGADFEVILTWDQDRFGRFNSLEAGYWIHPLMQAGIRLVTVTDGPVNWNDFAGRVVFSVKQEGKHQYLQDLSRNVTRGRLAAMKDDSSSPAPVYGYDRLFCDPSGKFMQRVPCGEKFTKPKGWTVKLVPADDDTTATVKWMFETYADLDCGIHWLVTELNRKQVPTPRGGVRWSWVGVRYILSNPIYAGIRAHGRHTSGKYHHIADDGTVTSGNGKKRHNTRKAPLFVFEGEHEPLVNQATFDRVQKKIASRGQDRAHATHGRYILTGVLYCGHCGGKLYGGPGGGKKKGSYTLHYYQCGPGTKHGPAVCKRYRVRQDQIEPYVLNLVQEALASPEAADVIRKAVSSRVKRRAIRSEEKRSLKAKISDLDRKIKKGSENILLADAATMLELARVLSDWQQQRATLQDRLDATTARASDDPDELVNRAMAELGRLRKHLETGDPLKVRAVVKAVVSKVTLWWEEVGRRREVSRGLVEFNTQGTNTLNRSR